MKAQFDFNITKVVETDGIALMHTEWTVSQPRPIACMRSRLRAGSLTGPGVG